MTEYLRCPLCDADVIAQKRIECGQPMWDEDMQGVCKGCGAECITVRSGDRDEYISVEVVSAPPKKCVTCGSEVRI